MAVALVFGGHAELTKPVDDYYSEGALSVKTDYENDVVRISDWNYSDGNVAVHLDPVRRGKTFVTIYNHDEPMTFLAVYVHADGIGAKTKSYFWINAFISEFVATMYSERKQHMTVLGILLIILLAMVILLYLAMHV